MGPNDYKVKVNGKEKTMHANLLKKCLSRDDETSSRTREMISTFRRMAVVDDYEADNGHNQDFDR